MVVILLMNCSCSHNTAAGYGNIRIHSYLIIFISYIIMLEYMSITLATKNIGTVGTSKMVTVTQEAKELGLDVKDSVVVAFAKPNSQQDYALRLAGAFCNPNALYINDRVLCSADSDHSGQRIENLLNDSNRDELELINNRFIAMQQLIDKIREYTKNEVSGQYAYYSEELRTFLVKFDPDDLSEDDPIAKNIKETLAFLNALEACLKLPIYAHSEIDSVRKLSEYAHRAFQDTVRLHLCEPDKRKDLLKDLNKVWQEEVNNVVYKDLYFVGLVIPYHTVDGNRIFDCNPIIETISAPTPRLANKKILDTHPDSDGVEHIRYVLGPYDDESECRALVSYLDLKWKMEIKKSADENTAVWVKNTINDYNILMG